MDEHQEQKNGDENGEVCAPCVHAAEHGWWGDLGSDRTHCKRCHRSWASLREIHCVSCCRHFVNPAACDAHLSAGDAPCVDPSDIRRKKDGEPKFEIVDRGKGPVFKLKFYGTRPSFGA